MDDAGVARPGSYLEFAYRELFRVRLVLISISISCVVVLFYGVAGPGEDVLTQLLPRLGYFGSIAVVSWPTGHGMAALLLFFVRRRHLRQVVLASLAGAVYIAVNVAMVGYAIHHLISYGGENLYPWSDYYLRALLPSLVHVGVINYLACQRARLSSGAGAVPADAAESDTPPGATEMIADPGPASAPQGAAAASAVASSSGADQAAGLQARFLDRLPPEVGRDVIFLKVSGHYITVVTTAGSGILLMRFADAVAELEGAGMQVHRSFWVAFRHVTAVEQREGRTVACLTGGEVVPVSRTFVAAVRAAATRESISVIS